MTKPEAIPASGSPLETELDWPTVSARIEEADRFPVRVAERAASNAIEQRHWCSDQRYEEAAMMKALTRAVVATPALSGFGPQDPATTLPDAYAKQFENEWVRVVRVHYPPYAKLPAHAHNALPAAYVYLNDGGPVLFKHLGTSYGAATRPATRAGGFRVFRGIDEIHEVENTSELPSHFLRVEFKTDPKDVSTLKGRFYREVPASGENLEKVQFENDQVRITRLVCAPERSIRVAAAPSEPSLLIALPDGRLRAPDGSKTAFALGQERWLPAGTTVVLENDGEVSEVLRFDLKTGPLTSSGQR